MIEFLLTIFVCLVMIFGCIATVMSLYYLFKALWL